MEDDRLDLGLVDTIDATDVGEPGQRTFKITVAGPRGEAVVWMEKEQMFQIGLSIKQFISLEDPPSSPATHEPEYPAPPTPARAEFKASEMSIRYDPRSDIFTIEATDPESESEDDNEEPATTLQFSFARDAGARLSDAALEAVSKGRPRCELCGGPKDPGGHVCPKTNGHHKGDFELA